VETQTEGAAPSDHAGRLGAGIAGTGRRSWGSWVAVRLDSQQCALCHKGAAPPGNALVGRRQLRGVYTDA
jgi:hypothetical protein